MLSEKQFLNLNWIFLYEFTRLLIYIMYACASNLICVVFFNTDIFILYIYLHVYCIYGLYIVFLNTCTYIFISNIYFIYVCVYVQFVYVC